MTTIIDLVLNSELYYEPKINLSKKLKKILQKLYIYINKIDENQINNFLLIIIKFFYLKDKHKITKDNELLEILYKIENEIDDIKNENEILYVIFNTNNILKYIKNLFLPKNSDLSLINREISFSNIKKYILDTFIITGEYNHFYRYYYNSYKRPDTYFGHIGILYLIISENNFEFDIELNKLHPQLENIFDYLKNKMIYIEWKDLEYDGKIFIKNKFIYHKDIKELKILIINNKKYKWINYKLLENKVDKEIYEKYDELYQFCIKYHNQFYMW